MSKAFFLILSGNGWSTENTKVLLELHDPQNLEHPLWVSELRRLSILSLPLAPLNRTGPSLVPTTAYTGHSVRRKV